MSVKENIIQQKSFAFAVRSINAYKFLTQDKKEFILSKQFLRSATSIGANVEDATEICKILAKIKITMKKDN